MRCGTVLVWVTCLTGMAVAIGLGEADSQIKSKPQNNAGAPQLVLTQKPGPLRFNVELQNSGSMPLILNVGMMLANGKELYPDRIKAATHATG